MKKFSVQKNSENSNQSHSACCQSTSALKDHESESNCSCSANQPDSNVISCGYTSSDQTTRIGQNNKKGILNFFKHPENRKRLQEEILKSSGLILKFMTLAFFLEAIITYYIPNTWIEPLLGGNSFIAIIVASFIGVPLYTSSIAALGIISGLMAKGMIDSAALAFLIAGPVTTIPAMSAVYGIVKPRVFLLYLSYAFAGSLLFGFLHYIFPFWGS